ncbi:hypothetical protein MN608_10889 [Microdochium nivale]|nr:hypothetical protein MN608_10889 [Microdochium nivale]
MAPWAIVAASPPRLTSSRTLSRGAAVDPFDALPCPMPYNSKRLLHYFRNTDSMLFNVKSLGLEDCSRGAEPNALRGALLVAISHYTWMTGDVETYRTTGLFHKLKSIQIINEDLREAGTIDHVHGVRLVCTLAIVEACQGNMLAAQTHISGLMATLTANPAPISIWCLERELSERYVMLAYYFVTILQQRVRDTASAEEEKKTHQRSRRAPCSAEPHKKTKHRPSSPRATPTLEGGMTPATTTCEVEGAALGLIRQGHAAEEREGLRRRLETIRMVPYFFSPVPAHVSRLVAIDAATLMEAMRGMTDDVDALRASPRGSEEGTSCRRVEMLWDKGSATDVWCVMIEAHVRSLSGRASSTAASSLPSSSTSSQSSPSQTRQVRAHWAPFSAAVGVYMFCVLGMAEYDPRFLRWVASCIGETEYNNNNNNNNNKDGTRGSMAKPPGDVNSHSSGSSPAASTAAPSSSRVAAWDVSDERETPSSRDDSTTSSIHSSPGACKTWSQSSRGGTIPLHNSPRSDPGCCPCRHSEYTHIGAEKDLQFWIIFMGLVAIYKASERDVASARLWICLPDLECLWGKLKGRLLALWEQELSSCCLEEQPGFSARGVGCGRLLISREMSWEEALCWLRRTAWPQVPVETWIEEVWNRVLGETGQ